MKRLPALVLLIFLFSPPLSADQADHTLFGRAGDRYGPKRNAVTFTPFYGWYFDGKNQHLATSADHYTETNNVGFRFGWAFHEYAEFEASLGYTPTKTLTADQNVYYYLFNAVGQYPVLDQWVPYATFGLGGIYFAPSNVNGEGDFAIDYGVGLKYFVFKNLAIRPDFRVITSFGSFTNHAFLPSINLTYYASVGKPKPGDRDRDGIADPNDRCPDAPESINQFQDEDGCPDETPAVVTVMADRDKDQIADSEDECPDKPETKNGYKDGDGCPDTIPSYEVIFGDKDGDGIKDDLDKCPEVPETVNGIKDDDGCPDRDIDEFLGVLEGVYFKFNQAEIETASYSVLEKVANVLKKYPKLKIQIDGHTDSDGPDGYNMKLSKDRAESVRHALMAQGVQSNRLTTRGYGEKRPIAANDSPTGKALNRRIELKLLNPKVLDE
ncbi:MAG TPA: OmpA family protein [Bdellovibrionota bacterium]|nr:OmpA family protein [Bdellovibrionota bacterium]